jgi:hypothetical protein
MQHADANRRRVAAQGIPATRFHVTPLLATYTAHGVAMAPFSSFVDLLIEIEDPRRAEGKLYRPPHVVLFAILAIVAGANCSSKPSDGLHAHFPHYAPIASWITRK